MGYFTKYICFYKLDNNYTLLLNTLTSAVDIVDNETLTEIKAMIKKHNNKVIIDKNYPLYGVLKKRGYIFDNESAEKNTLNFLEVYLIKYFLISLLQILKYVQQWGVI